MRRHPAVRAAGGSWLRVQTPRQLAVARDCSAFSLSRVIDDDRNRRRSAVGNFPINGADPGTRLDLALPRLLSLVTTHSNADPCELCKYRLLRHGVIAFARDPPAQAHTNVFARKNRRAARS